MSAEVAGHGVGEASVLLVTYADNTEVFDWGLHFDQVALPLLVYGSRAFIEALSTKQPSPSVRASVWEHEPPTPGKNECTLAQKQALLQRARADQPQARTLVWIDLGLCYRHLSFEFLYSPALLAVLSRLPRLTFFPVPSYPPHSFFGGPVLALDPWLSMGDGAHASHFAVWPGAGEVADPNLYLAPTASAPVLHVIGDSHVYNCFTPNGLIGCRDHVLFRPEAAWGLGAGYSHQFSHHMGGITMHRAGRAGEMQQWARRCGVKSGDAVVWVMGEIDVRCHLVRLHETRGQPLGAVVDAVADRFAEALAELELALPQVLHIVFAPIPPLDNPDYRSNDLPIWGTILQRIEARQRLVQRLGVLCDAHGWLLFDIGATYSNERGDLRWAQSDHFCHLGHGHQADILQRLYAQVLAYRSQPDVLPVAPEPPAASPQRLPASSWWHRLTRWLGQEG